MTIEINIQRIIVLMMLMFFSNSITFAGENSASTHYCQLSFPQSSSPNINTVYIPFTLVGQLIMVEATADTTTGLFIVDTGSERLVLNRNHVARQSGQDRITSVGNTGMVSNAMAHHTDSLRIDPLVIRRLYAHVVDLGHIEVKKNVRLAGILGYDVFKDFELFIDYGNRMIVLFRLDDKGNRLDTAARRELPHDSLSFTQKRHLIVVEAKVNHVRTKMIVDTGAELNLIDRGVNRKVLEKFSIIKRVSLTGVGQQEIEVLAGVLKDVYCGNQFTASMNTLLTNLDEFREAFEVSADGVLGYEFLKSRRTLINYKKRMMYFFKPIRS
jgi:hypothetical protein